MAPSIAAPVNLPDLVRAAFVRARAAGDLTFFPTQVALLRVHGVPFQLRFAPSLAKKPKGPKPAGSSDKTTNKTASGDAPPFYDPFDNPQPGLLVVPQLGPAHHLILNKFAICQDHAILATTAFRPQHHLLDAVDLAAAYACIEAYHAAAAASPAPATDDRGELFVFYNSGRHSGASQPHRHLQMLPVACMREGLEGADAAAWAVLADRLLDTPQAAGGAASESPFFVAAAQLRDADDDGDRTPSPEALHVMYLDLYRQACAAAQGTAAVLEQERAAQEDEEQGRAPARISYNLALTRRTMALVPRAAEGAPVEAASGASSTGALSLNGTLLAGTALVKDEFEWDALRGDPAQLARILGQIGLSARGSPGSSSL